jgi:hypothetical protein
VVRIRTRQAERGRFRGLSTIEHQLELHYRIKSKTISQSVDLAPMDSVKQITSISFVARSSCKLQTIFWDAHVDQIRLLICCYVIEEDEKPTI